MRWRTYMLVLTALLVLAGTTGAAEQVERSGNTGYGTMTSLESDGSVIINDQGFNVSPFVRVRDGIGQRVKLDELQLPMPVAFEFEHSSRGPVIKSLKVVPQ